MKHLIEMAESYLKNQTPDGENMLNNRLQSLSASVDVSVWNPDTIVVSKLYTNLYRLVFGIEETSALIWSCVDILRVICRNFRARDMLVNTYQFLPPLSPFLGDHLTKNRKIKLLNLMQELTCGIKISWQIPHLPHLIRTLTKWITTQKDETLPLSLALLNNLCYKNLPALYTLTRCVDLKDFVRSCSALRGPKTAIYVCKLLIILEDFNGKVPETVIFKLIEHTFESVTEALQARNSTFLQHSNKFFVDVFNQRSYLNYFLNFNYENKTERLTNKLENVINQEIDYLETSEYVACVESIFAFIYIIINLAKNKLKHLYERLINISLRWVDQQIISIEALSILRYILTNIKEDEFELIKPIINRLPILFSALENNPKVDIISQLENHKYLSQLMEILRVLVTVQTTRQSVLSVLREDVIQKIFDPFLCNELKQSGASINNTESVEAMILYVNVIGLLNELIKHDHKWYNFYKVLLKEKEIQRLLANALLKGPQETKLLILSINSNEYCPINEIAQAMCQIHPPRLKDVELNSEQCSNMLDNISFPLMSITKISKLDEVISKVQEAFKDNNLLKLSTSNIIELYEYKLATISQAERIAIANLETATGRCTELQYQNAQFTAQLLRLHQLLLHSEHSYEEALKIKENIVIENKQLQENFLAEIHHYKIKISDKEQSVSEKVQQTEDIIHQINDTNNINKNLEEKLQNMIEQERMLQKKIDKQNKNNSEKEEQSINLNSFNENLKIGIVKLEERLQSIEIELSGKIQELTITTNEFRKTKDILERITALTTGNH